MQCAQCGRMLSEAGEMFTGLYREPRAMFFDINANPICMPCWASLFDMYEYRKIGSTRLGDGDLAVDVSTVWLGNDMNFSGVGPPIIFETMIFSDNRDDLNYCEWYATYEDALAGHELAVQWARENLFLTWDREHQHEGEQ